MQPIHELLSRIRWDAEFGRGDFVIGYYDRIADLVVGVPLRFVHFDAANHFACRIRTKRAKSTGCRSIASAK